MKQQGEFSDLKDAFYSTIFAKLTLDFVSQKSNLNKSK